MPGNQPYAATTARTDQLLTCFVPIISNRLRIAVSPPCVKVGSGHEKLGKSQSTPTGPRRTSILGLPDAPDAARLHIR